MSLSNHSGNDVGTDTIRYVLQQVSRLSNDWGGYVNLYGGRLDNSSMGMFSIYFNHFGSDDSASNHEITPLLNYNPHSNRILRFDNRYQTFLEYQVKEVQEQN